MLRSVKRLRGYTIGSRDGEIGWVRDVYFDDERWAVRYLVVDGARRGREILIASRSLTGIDPERKVIRASLTREQVAHSPDIDTSKPVSRQHDRELCDYYGFPYEWSGSVLSRAHGCSPAVQGAARSGYAEAVRYSEDRHLRSAHAVTHHYVHARDGDIGRVGDLLFDDLSWAVRYVVVATGSWWPDRNVLVPVGWVSRVSLEAGTVDLALRTETIRLAPAYDGGMPSPDYERRLAAYYGPPPFGPA